MAKKITERYGALIILAALLFNPPIMSIFNSTRLIFGVPMLFLYLFVAWALVIGFNAYLAKKLSAEQLLAKEREAGSDTDA
ncbi:MAG: hypothetical protein HN731_03965 [Rhodospirillaceae bacterium]|nr:hypothetical protein [Rhodospirillaceae bacterium]